MRINDRHIFRQFYFLFVLLSMVSVDAVFAQQKGPTGIEAKFEAYRKSDLQEKLFVQTNKAFYVAGEVLWFKIFDINGATNTPFDFSQVAYVELLDKSNIPVLQTKVALDKDKSGSLALPVTIHSGSYTFRAYTSWMKNFPPAFYFHKKITIVNTTLSNDLPAADSLAAYEIHFFPEGGNLVNGLQSTVAFKVTDQNGKGVSFKGVVVDQRKDSILHFQPLKFGMGRFSFTPRQGDLYQAVIRTPDGQTITKDLPVAYNEGYVLHVEEGGAGRIKINVQTNIPVEQRAFLLIHTRASVKVADALSLADGKAEIAVSKDELGAGISQITLFNSKQQPVCERLYFKPVRKKLNIQGQSNKRQYATRSEVNLALNTSDENGKAVPAAMTVSVYRLDSLQTVEESNLFNYLWLSSELTGDVAHPSFYFQNGQSQAMDNLMLTQGWRRFDWEEVLQKGAPTFEYAPELSGPVASGKVTNGGIPVSGALVYLAIPGKHVRLFASQSNTAGDVFFNMKGFYGPGQVVVRTNPHSKDRNDEIKLLNPFSEKYTATSGGFRITPEYTDLLRSHNLWMQVTKAYQENKINQWLQESVDTTAFYGKPYKTYLLDNYTRYVTMEEVLREYVMEVAVRKERQHYHLKVMNALFAFDQHISATLFEDDPLVLFDGVPVFDIDKVMAYDPLKVQKIEVVAGRYFYGPVVADGIVSLTTYDGVLEDYPLDPQAIVLDYDGLQRQRIFYSPESERLSSRIPDFRNALYWSPVLSSDSSGHAGCTFYTSDLPGKYVVVVNGITGKGRAGSSVFTFTVRK